MRRLVGLCLLPVLLLASTLVCYALEDRAGSGKSAGSAVSGPTTVLRPARVRECRPEPALAGVVGFHLRLDPPVLQIRPPRTPAARLAITTALPFASRPPPPARGHATTSSSSTISA